MLSGDYSAIGAGERVRLSGSHSFIGGGLRCVSSGINSVIAGGEQNTLYNQHVSIGGGSQNVGSGNYATIPGGLSNICRNNFTFAAGRQSIADSDGAFVLSDARSIDKVSAGQNTLTADFSGGCWITGGGLNARRGFNLFPTGVTPTSSIGGRSGDFAYKDDYFYIFTGDNADLSNRNWGRVQLSTLNNTPPSVVSNDSEIVHGRGYNYTITNAFVNVTFENASPIVTIPAGQGTWLIECMFGAYKGSSLATVVDAYLWNDTDSVRIPNTSGSFTMIAAANNKPIQHNLRTITGTNYGAGKLVRLVVKTQANEDATVVSTGTWISWIRLR